MAQLTTIDGKTRQDANKDIKQEKMIIPFDEMMARAERYAEKIISSHERKRAEGEEVTEEEKQRYNLCRNTLYLLKKKDTLTTPNS